jgi:hypothetical protein
VAVERYRLPSALGCGSRFGGAVRKLSANSSQAPINLLSTSLSSKSSTSFMSLVRPINTDRHNFKTFSLHLAILYLPLFNMDNTHPHPPAAPGRLQGSFSASTASDPSLATMSASFSNTLDTVPVSQSRSSNARWQAKHNVRKTQTTNLPGYLCFSLSGEPVKAAHRSAFSPMRREQVKQLRKQRACLRCKLMKRAVRTH